LYADRMTDSIQFAIAETTRRRQIQQEYNTKHGIIPKTVVREVVQSISKAALDLQRAPKKPSKRSQKTADSLNVTPEQLQQMIISLEQEMQAAAQNFDCERAMELRDQLLRLKAMQ